MFWKKDRTKEQEEKAKKVQENAERNQQIQTTVKQLQGQIVERTKEVSALKKELEKARAGEQAAANSRKRLRDMRREMSEMQKKLKEAQETIEAQNEDEVEDLEELPAEKQKEIHTGLKDRLAEAMQNIGQLESEVAVAEEEDAPTAMEVGSNAWVRREGGQALNRRDGPGLNSNVLDSLPIGTQVTLLEGPNPADNYTWWRVRASDGREGWVAGEELVNQPE